MKVLHINTSDISGGAARAAYRLSTALRKNGVESYMLAQKKLSDDVNVIGFQTKLGKGWSLVKPEIDKLPLKIFNTNQSGPWSVNWFPTNITKKIKEINPDIVNLHWIGNGMISIRELRKIKKPIVWTMHDMWPFSGGFHYSQKYINHDNSLISNLILKSKIKKWKDLNIYPVSPSEWLANLARKSKLFNSSEISVIPNGLNTTVFKPTDKKVAKRILNLKQNKKYILFGAMKATSDKRKGFQFLLPAIKKLSENINTSKFELLIFGASAPKKPPNFNMTTNYIGKVNSDVELSLMYSASNVTILPSVQDNLPNVVMESLSCGTPCVGFKIGGTPDMIDHKQNGYLAKPYKPTELAKGIFWCIKNTKRNRKLGINARNKVLKEYSLAVLSQNYIKLYHYCQKIHTPVKY